MYYNRTKHMGIDFYFVRDWVAVKTLQVQFCNSKEQLADAFTKQLVSARFFTLQSSLWVLDTPLDSLGHISLSYK